MSVILIAPNLQLHPVSPTDDALILQIMRTIYPPVYQHLWPDQGEEYLYTTYTLENLKEEISDINAYYFLIQYQNEYIGIFRIVFGQTTPGIKASYPNLQYCKLHRIYLHPKVHGKGIGKQLFDWLQRWVQPETAIWLEVMNTQKQAIGFYQRHGFEAFENFTFDSSFLPSVRMIPEYTGMIRMVKLIL